jgi:galacturan 1,4-alpha-galacturonidase
MKLLPILALCATAVTSLVFNSPDTHTPPGAKIYAGNDIAELKRIGAHHHKHHDRRTVTIRSSHNDTDDISADFLWGIRRANRGGRLLLKKGKKYVIGRKLDLTFLEDVEVQLDGELKVFSFFARFFDCL